MSNEQTQDPQEESTKEILAALEALGQEITDLEERVSTLEGDSSVDQEEPS